MNALVLDRKMLRIRYILSLPAVVAAAIMTASCDSPTGTVEPTTVEITAPSAYVEVGQTLLLSATGKAATGQPLKGVRVRWSSLSPEVAEVTDGLVTGRTGGEAVIVATAGAAADSLVVTVEPAVGEIVVRPNPLYLLQGRVGKLFVEVRDAAGRPLAQPLRWTNPAPGVAMVEGNEVRGISPGHTTLTATAGLKSVQVTVLVATGARYTARYLGTLRGGSSQAFGLNNRGEVVGVAATSTGADRAFLWDRGHMTDLGTVSGFEHSRALAISDGGIVVGSAENRGFSSWSPPVQTRPWIREGDRLRPIEVDFTTAEAVDVNDRGQVVVSGLMTTTGGGSHTRGRSWLWEGGTLTELTLPGSLYAHATAINGRGAVGLTAFWPANGYDLRIQAYRWDGSGYTPLSECLVVTDLDDRGRAVGYLASNPRVVAMWDGNTLVEVPAMTGVRASNESGDMVGWKGWRMPGSEYSPVLLRGGQAYDLDALVSSAVWEIWEAHAINDLGWIAATGKHRVTGGLDALLLTPAS